MQSRALHIVFDLDGTLVDSVHDLASSASELVTSLGGRPLAVREVALMVGDGAGLLVRRALEASGLAADTPGALETFLDIYDRRLLDETTVYPGIESLLQLCSRRARLSVLTNKPLAPSIRILEALTIARFFDAVVGGDGPLGRKPDPAGYRSLVDAAQPSVLVGDSPIDAATAGNAGVPFVWARYGFGAQRFSEAPDTPYVLDRPTDLAAVIDRIAAVTSGA